MEKSTYLSADGKTNIAYYIFDEGVQKPRAIVQISHGMMDYIYRYAFLIDFLNKNDIIVCGNDDLGHGKTGENQGEFGYFGKKYGDKYVLKDLHTLTTLIKDKYKNYLK